MQQETTKKKVRSAICSFIKDDRDDLYLRDVYEPTFSHRIAVYLESEFPKYKVDCEYNKHLGDYKKNPDGKHIRPDIIVHKERNSDCENLVIIEVKKAGEKSKLGIKDIEKLEGCIDDSLKYRLGVFIGILKKRIDIVWVEYTNGTIIKTSESL